MNLDASDALSSVLLTGIVDQAYSSLELDYSAGTYEGYQVFYTGITGQSFTSEEVDVSAAGQPEKVVYSGMTSTPYSSAEVDYSGGAFADVIYNFTNVTGASYYSYQVEDNPSGAMLQETLDLNSGGHDLIALASGQTLTSLGDDMMIGSATGSTTFVLNAVYGADTIANLTDSDIVSMPNSEFASFTDPFGRSLVRNRRRRDQGWRRRHADARWDHDIGAAAKPLGRLHVPCMTTGVRTGAAAWTELLNRR